MTPAAVGSGRREGGRVVWQLLLTLWVGSVWSLHFVFLPALEQSGLAPLLVDDAALTLRPAVLGISAVAMLLHVCNKCVLASCRKCSSKPSLDRGL